jgi:small subunit ribosomal protein S7
VPRKGPAPKRTTIKDPKYGSELVTQLINRIMRDGKRSTAERIVYDALALIGGRTQGGDPLSVMDRAVLNVKPSLEVKSRRVGGATYQVPIEVRPSRQTTLAMRWLVGYARIRREKSMAERLAGEILDASNGVGAAVKRKEDTLKMAEANRAFAHYRW